MPFHMQPSQFPAGGFPEGDAFPPGASDTFPIGTPLTFNTGTQKLNEHGGGATVTNVKGVSLDGVTAGVAHDPSGKVSFASANRTNTFVAKLINGSGVVQTVSLANINLNYGILKQSTLLNQWWGVDSSDTTDVVVEVIGIDTALNVVFFKFIESAIQNN